MTTFEYLNENNELFKEMTMKGIISPKYRYWFTVYSRYLFYKKDMRSTMAMEQACTDFKIKLVTGWTIKKYMERCV